MARWLVTDGDRQFSAGGLDELKELAARGEINSGTMVQPPGAADWLYATEIPELRGCVRSPALQDGDDDDFMAQQRGGRGRFVIAALVVLVMGGGFFFWKYASSIPNMSELSLLGGPHGLDLTQMLTTQDGAAIRKEPSENGHVLAQLKKDEKVQLLAKRDSWYEVERSGGIRGWVAVDHVVPAYFFADKRERENYDPIFNPDRYLAVVNPRWLQLPPEDGRAKGGNVTVFQFALKNESKFEMEDIRLRATIKDGRHKVLEQREFAVEGAVAPYDATVVGTISPPDDQPDGAKRRMTYSHFSDLAKGDEDMWFLWSDGVEVEMSSTDYSEADIVLVQAKAIPTRQR